MSGEQISSTVTQVSLTRMEVAYRLPSGQKVLEVIFDTATRHTELNSFEESYWSIFIDGRPASKAELLQLSGHEKLHIDEVEKTINATTHK